MNLAYDQEGVSPRAVRLAMRNWRKQEALLAMNRSRRRRVPRFRCQNRGCSQMLFREEIAFHERYCEFRSYGCPFDRSHCNWEGPLVDMVDHLERVHMILSNECNHLEVGLHNSFPLYECNWGSILCCFGRKFLLTARRTFSDNGNYKIILAIRLLETDNRRFLVTIRLQRRQQNIYLCGNPASIESFYYHEFSSSIVLDHMSAQQFTSNGIFHFGLKIKLV